MTIYLKHHTANFVYALDLDSQQVEMCCTVSGRERVERYEGGSGALQTGNVLITQDEYQHTKQYALGQLSQPVHRQGGGVEFPFTRIFKSVQAAGRN